MAPRRKQPANLATWLGTAATPLFVLDNSRRIRVFNVGCQLLTGWTAPDVVGEICLYTTHPDASSGAAVAASLCPPPEVLQGNALAAPTQIVCQDGRLLPRIIHFFPLSSRDGEITGCIGFISAEQASPAEPLPVAYRVHAELAAVRGVMRQRYGANSLVTRSIEMKRVLAQLDLAIRADSWTLLHGEPGCGRSHLARVIHYSGTGQNMSCIQLDCRRLAADEMERVLERAFERFHSMRPVSPAIQIGTIVFTDVECLPRDLQQRVCHELSSRDRASAATECLPRVIATTSRPWKELVAEGKLRAEFATLLTPLVIEIPPLRDRREDISLLAQYFLEEINRQGDKTVVGLSDEAARILEPYQWPGNLDELFEVMKACHDTAQKELIEPADLPARFRDPQATNPAAAQRAELDLDRILTESERRVISLALKRSQNNRSKAAEILGIHRTRLLRRIAHLGLDGGTPVDSTEANAVKEKAASSEIVEHAVAVAKPTKKTSPLSQILNVDLSDLEDSIPPEVETGDDDLSGEITDYEEFELEEPFDEEVP